MSAAVIVVNSVRPFSAQAHSSLIPTPTPQSTDFGVSSAATQAAEHLTVTVKLRHELQFQRVSRACAWGTYQVGRLWNPQEAGHRSTGRARPNTNSGFHDQFSLGPLDDNEMLAFAWI